MSVFSNSSISSVLFGHNASVKAWCLTARNLSSPETQTQFDAVNFIDGYNLRLDVETQMSGGIAIRQTNDSIVNFSGTNSGALKFSFITPMPDNKYKVFLQFYRNNITQQTNTFAHVLNSATFPKTRNSFWVRTGLLDTNPNNPSVSNKINSVRLGTVNTLGFNLGVIVL